MAQREPEREAEAQRELRPRDDGAVHARGQPRRVHRDRRPRAGPRAHRLEGLGREQAADGVRLRRDPARHRLEDDLRPDGQLGLAGLVRALPRQPAAPVVLRHEALELLRPDAARRGHELGAAGAVREAARPAGRRGDPAPPGLLRGAADGEAAGRLQRGSAACDRPADRHVDLVVARPAGRPAALLPAGRRRLGRHALARHRDVPRALVHRRARPGRRPAERVAERPRAARAARGRLLGRPDAHAADDDAPDRVREGAAHRNASTTDVETGLRRLVASAPDLQTA